MAKISELAMTVSEAAFVTGLSARVINHEIDERIIESASTPDGRKVAGVDLVYLGAIKNIRVHLGQTLRRRIRQAIVEASRAAHAEATVDRFTLALSGLEREVWQGVDRLDRIKHLEIESLPSVLQGEPVVTGTRIAARHIADLVKRGETPEVIATELDLTPEQVEAAVAFDRVTPRLGRPARRKAEPSRVSSAG